MLKAADISALKVDLGELFSAIENCERIGLAVSGGPDSVALMGLIHAWSQGKSTPAIHVLSVDHGLRPEAAKEVDFVGDLARKYGFAFHGVKWDGPKPNKGLMAAARDARYRLMAQECAQHEIEVLLTGHHLDDQAETVLMRLAHKSGIDGLAGMQPQMQLHGLRIARPLLKLTRGRLAQIVECMGVQPVDDPSNKKTEFERVRWRNHLPQLAEFGLDADCLNTFANRANRASTALDFYAQKTLKDHAHQNQFGGMQLPLGALGDAPQEIAIRMLQTLIGKVSRGEWPANLAQVEELAAQLLKGDFDGATLAGAHIMVRHEIVHIFPEKGRVPPSELVVPAQAKLIWNDRVCVQNLSNQVLHVGSAYRLTRKQIEAQIGELNVPLACAQSAPAVWNEAGQLIHIGLGDLETVVELVSI